MLFDILKTMLLTPHTMVGIAIGATVSEPHVAVPLAFALHFAGDLVPHWDFFTGIPLQDFNKGYRPVAIMADIALGVAVGIYFTLHALWLNNNPSLAATIFLCGIAGVLPDAMSAKVIYGNGVEKKNSIFNLVFRIQEKLQISAGLPWGIITQLGVMLVAFLATSHSLAL